MPSKKSARKTLAKSSRIQTPGYGFPKGTKGLLSVVMG